MQKSTIYRKPMGENLFEEEFTIEALSQMGNPLDRLAALVDFEMFRPALEEVLVKKDCKTPAGRPQIDVALMFKVIFVEGAMNGSLVRSTGMMRAKAANALTNLVYNIFRYVQINHYQPQLITSKG